MNDSYVIYKAEGMLELLGVQCKIHELMNYEWTRDDVVAVKSTVDAIRRSLNFDDVPPYQGSRVEPYTIEGQFDALIDHCWRATVKGTRASTRQKEASGMRYVFYRLWDTWEEYRKTDGPGPVHDLH